MNVSNTLLVGFKEYLKQKTCGKFLQAMYVDKTIKIRDEDQSDEIKAGKYFEFLVIKTKNRDGSEPAPILTATGKVAAITNHVKGQVDNFKAIYSQFKILETSKVLEVEIDGIKYKGILDVLVEMSKIPAIRDIKVSGMIANKWEVGGWECLTGNGFAIPEKKHLDQAKMYAWLWYELTGEIVDFYFDIFSNTNPDDCKTIKIRFTEEAILGFREDTIGLAKMLVEELKTGLKAIPELQRCNKCPLSGDCKDRTYTPEIEEYFIS